MQLSAVIVSFRSYFLLFPCQGQNTKIVLAPLSLRRKSGLSPWVRMKYALITEL